jgi:hypothetical protein
VVLNKELSDEDVGEAFSNIFKAEDNDYNNKENNKDKELNGLENREVDAKRSLSKAVIPKTRKTKWDKFKTLLNVYIRLYIADNVREYIYIINCNVLSSEMTYMYVLAFSSINY